MSENLTKKQQKALAFRSKQKTKKSGKQEVVPDDVPEQDLVEDDVDLPEVAEVKEKDGKGAESSKKRKRDDGAVEVVGDEDVSEDKKEEKAGKKPAKGKGKAKNAWDEGEEGAEGEEGDGEGKKSKKEIKQRFILFVGNLGFKTTREEVQAHFAEAAGDRPAVRLLTTKPDPKTRQPPKSRGIAFLEVASSAAMQACLKLHHSSIAGRRINVELTAGGGGKSESRQEKIKTRNERVGGQRERRAEREKEEGVEGGAFEEGQGGAGGARGQGEEQKRTRGGKRKHDDPAGPSRDGPSAGGDRPERQDRQVEVVRADGEVVNADGSTIKIRGGRRVKAKVPGQSNDQRDAKRSRYDGGGQGGQGGYGGQGGQGGYGGDRGHGGGRGGGYGGGGRGGGRGGGYQGGQGGREGGRGFRPKWEPTGANAVSVG